MLQWLWFAVDVVAVSFIAVGLVFSVLGVLGLFRMPDAILRMQATSKAVVLGASMILTGIAMLSTVQLGIKALGTMVFVFLTSPIATFAVARAAYRRGDRVYGPLLIDELERDRKADTRE